MSPPHNLYQSIQMLLWPQRNVFFNNFHVLWVAEIDPHNATAKSPIKGEQKKTPGRNVTAGHDICSCSALK